jgi:hypothetical protein
MYVNIWENDDLTAAHHAQYGKYVYIYLFFSNEYYVRVGEKRENKRKEKSLF